MSNAQTLCVIPIASLLAVGVAQAAGVRDFTRSAPSTTVNEAQASELTLTLTEAAMRPVQNWIRTAGTVDKTGKIVTTFLRGRDMDLVRVGQRTRAYTIDTRAKMTLGFVTRVVKQPSAATVEVTLSAPVASESTDYLMEIVVERGPYLSVPNVSIIEEGDEHVVYLQKEPGRYVPQTIQTGVQGELYTQVTDGLKEGDQVVSIGSFFVDADTKLKSAGMAAMPGMDHGSMPGMVSAGAVGSASQSIMTDPEADATVKGPLYMFHVMFPQPVDVKSAGFAVSKDGQAVDVGQAIPMGDDGTIVMAMPKTPMPAGKYLVKWHATAADAKPLKGEFSFTVQ